jgi:hypothetical protein
VICSWCLGSKNTKSPKDFLSDFKGMGGFLIITLGVWMARVFHFDMGKHALAPQLFPPCKFYSAPTLIKLSSAPTSCPLILRFS